MTVWPSPTLIAETSKTHRVAFGQNGLLDEEYLVLSNLHGQIRTVQEHAVRDPNDLVDVLQTGGVVDFRVPIDVDAVFLVLIYTDDLRWYFGESLPVAARSVADVTAARS